MNDRQRAAVVEAGTALQAALNALHDGFDEHVVTVDLYRAATALGTLTGAITREHVYAEIFARFCIGK